MRNPSPVTETVSIRSEDNHIYSGYGRQNSETPPRFPPPAGLTLSPTYSIKPPVLTLRTLLLSCSVTLTNALNFPNSQFSHLYLHLPGKCGVKKRRLVLCVSFKHERLTPRLSRGVTATPCHWATAAGSRGGRATWPTFPFFHLTFAVLLWFCYQAEPRVELQAFHRSRCLLCANRAVAKDEGSFH